MPNEVVGRCPVCGEAFEVTELQCPSCHTKLSGNFELCKFCKLTPEQRDFAEIFIKNRGNIRDVEKELGISYPTVRSRLENVIRALGYPVDESDNVQDDESLSQQRQKILERLSQGEITAAEAARLLKSIRPR